MEKPTTFTFESYAFDPDTSSIHLKYSFDTGEEFEEVLTLPTKNYAEYSPELLDRALFALHLIGGISYYKAACPKKIEIKSGQLSPSEAEFWNKLYTQGLGEFFYQNEIDFRGLIQFPSSDVEAKAYPAKKTGCKLLPFGGGKDSYVSFKKLEEKGENFTTFVLGEHPQILDFLEEIDQRPLMVKRQLSPELFKLNDEGALNGHIPISAYIAFATIVIGVIYGYEEIVLSNEKSADQGNVELHGMTINHQYSKSFEFEHDLGHYIHNSITPDIKYHSLLRPYSELEIAEQFAKYPEALPLFTSCNRNFKIKDNDGKKFWCCECPKCAFVYLMLAPFIEEEKLVETFGKNLLEDTALEDTYAELKGEKDIKPFECVGTYEEVNEAFAMLSKK